VLLIIAVYIAKHYGLFGLILYPLGDTILNFIVAYLIAFSIISKQSLINSWLNKKMITNVGILSYSLYLWQQLFIIPKGELINWSKYFIFPLNLLVIYIVAYLSHHYFEKPFLKIKQRFSLKYV
jgi:peptidoglycan/LPS O-acetylase OafA/YrhL